MASHFFVPPQHISPYLKKPTGILYDNNVPSLNSVKILTMRSVENYKILKSTSIWSDCWGCLPACLCIKPTSTRSIAPDFSHNKGNCVQFTKLLFRLRFIHCALFFLSFTVFLVLSLSVNYMVLIEVTVALSAYYITKTAACEHVR